MNVLIILAATLLAINAFPTLEQVNTQWTTFKINQNKSYTGHEELKRKTIFSNNLAKIQAHNERFAQGLETYTMAVNKFADLTQEEFIATLKAHKKPNRHSYQTKTFVPDLTIDLPETVDWRTKGAVTKVKNQGQCGSCWAFSNTGSLEALYYLETGKLVSFSEQELVDCSTNGGNAGCRGGSLEMGFEYVIHNGITTEEEYPYEAKDGKCRKHPNNSLKFISSYTTIKSFDEDDLKNAVATVGPISVAVDASRSWNFYHRGILNDANCGNTDEDLDHGVLAVGYGTENGLDYWLVKNSWGANWGENGYIKMARNANNNCGIATDAVYPNQ